MYKQQQDQQQRKDQNHFGTLGQKGIGTDLVQTRDLSVSNLGGDSDLDCLDSDYEEERDIPDSESHSPPTVSIPISTIYHPGRDDCHNGIPSNDREDTPGVYRNTPPTPWEITIPKIEERLSYLRARWKVDLVPSTSPSWDKTTMVKNTNTASLSSPDSLLALSSFKVGGVSQQNQVVYGKNTKMGESLHNELDLDTPEDNHQPDDMKSDTEKINLRMVRHRNVEHGEISAIRPPSYSCDLTRPSLCPTPPTHTPLFIHAQFRPLLMYTKGLPSDLIHNLRYWGACSINVHSKADVILFHRDRASPTPCNPKNSQEMKLFCQAFERGQKVLSSLWVEDSIKIGELQDEGPYEIWLDESDIPKKRAAAIKADNKRTMQHMAMYCLFDRGTRPSRQHQTMIADQDEKSEVLDLGSELESDEEFDGIGRVRKIGEKGLVTLHQFKFRPKPRS